MSVDTEKGCDPLTRLDDLVCRNIFNFLCEPIRAYQEDHNYSLVQTIWLRKIAREVHGPLRSVSTLWKETFDRNLHHALGPVAINLYENRAFIPKFIHWILLNPGFELISLEAPKAQLGDIPLLTKLINEKDTRNLRILRVPMKLEEGRCGSGYAIEQTPFLFVPSHQKEFHALIAEQCPNLIELEISLIIPYQRQSLDSYINPELFSLPNLQKLTVLLDIPQLTTFFGDAIINPFVSIAKESSILNLLVRTLPNLTHFKLHPHSLRTIHVVPADSVLYIESTSLEHLEVDPWKGPLACHCPRLQTLKTGIPNLPLINELQFRTELPRFFTMMGGLTVPAGEFSFPNFHVSESCQVTIQFAARLLQSLPFELYSTCQSTPVPAIIETL